MKTSHVHVIGRIHDYDNIFRKYDVQTTRMKDFTILNTAGSRKAKLLWGSTVKLFNMNQNNSPNDGYNST